MDKMQKDTNDALETTRKWNPLLMIFAMPLYLFLIIWASYFPMGVLRLASEDGHELVIQLTSIENSLIPPASFFGFLFLFSWLCFISFYIAIRIVYWIGFVLSLIYFIYIFVTKQRARKDFFASLNIKKFLNVILFLWLFMYGINLFTHGLNHFLAHLLLALLPISPILFGLFMVSFLKSYLVTLENLNAVNKNQEKYREEYGYTIEEWYGKKSKMYKEHVKKSKKR